MICNNAGKCHVKNCNHGKSHSHFTACDHTCLNIEGIEDSFCIPDALSDKEIILPVEEVVQETPEEAKDRLIEILEAKIMELGGEIEELRYNLGVMGKELEKFQEKEEVLPW